MRKQPVAAFLLPGRYQKTIKKGINGNSVYTFAWCYGTPAVRLSPDY